MIVIRGGSEGDQRNMGGHFPGEVRTLTRVRRAKVISEKRRMVGV